MSAAAPSSADLPPPEVPSSAQPGGFGWFVRCEIAWGRVRRAILRQFFPGHVAHWREKTRGDSANIEVVDARDVKFHRNCSPVWFDRDDDTYRQRENLGFARYGFAELVGFSVLVSTLLLISTLLAVFVSIYFLIVSTIIVFLWLEVLWFFRDPDRVIPTDPKAIVSPADGVVTHVESIDEQDFGPDTLRISIFLSVFNVHGNRVPHSGTFERAQYFRGRFLDARHPDCAKQNEQLWADFTDGHGVRFRIKQISGAIARRIVCWARPGEAFKAGDRYGMIKFGSRTEFLAPASRIKEILVKPGDKVRGGVTIIARMG